MADFSNHPKMGFCQFWPPLCFWKQDIATEIAFVGPDFLGGGGLLLDLLESILFLLVLFYLWYGFASVTPVWK